MGIRETANIDLLDIDYDVRIFDDPNLMRDELRELNKKVNEDCEINFNTVKDIAGYKTYRRTATFIMIKAIRDIAGDSVLNKIKVEFSIGKGIYNTISGDVDINIRFINGKEK